jgi:hypothetical protein
VATIFHEYPPEVQEKLLFLRQLIFDTAVATPGVGEIEETLKWGQPSYLTVKPKSGTTIRIDADSAQAGQYGIYFHCQSSMISTMRQLYPTEFEYEGNRAILFNEKDDLPLEAVRHCLALALTYHRWKNIK